MAFNLSAILSFSTKGFKSSLGQANKSLNKFQSNVKRAGQQARIVGTGLRNVGFAGTFLAAGIGLSVKAHSDLEKSLKSVAAKMPEGIKNFGALEKAAKKQGRETIFTAKEAAQGLEFLALAGFKAKEAIGVLPTILKLAGASNTDLGRTSDILTDSMSAMAPAMKKYGDRTKQATALADMMSFAQARTNTNVDQLGEAIKFGGGALANMGVPLNEIIGSMGALANAGLKGSIGGTSLLNMMNKLSKPTQKATKILNEMGISMDDIKTPEGKLKSMDEVIRILNKAVDSSPDVLKRAGAASELFGIRGQRAFFALKNQMKDLPELFKGLENSQGEAAKQYAIMTDSLFGVTKAFQSSVSGVQLEIGKMFTILGGFGALGKSITKPIIKFGEALAALNTPMEDWDENQQAIVKTPIGQFTQGLVKGIKSVVSTVKNIIGWMKQLVTRVGDSGISFEKVGKIVSILVTGLAIVGPILLGLGGTMFILAPIISGVGAAIGLVGTVLALLVSPVTLVIVAIGLLSFGLYKLMGGWQGITEAVTTFGKGFMETFQPIWVLVKEALLPMINEMTDAWGKVFAAFGGSRKASNDFSSFGKTIGSVAGFILKAITPVVGILVKLSTIIAKVVGFGVEKLKGVLSFFGVGKGEKIKEPVAEAAKPVKSITADEDLRHQKALKRIGELENRKKESIKKQKQNIADIIRFENKRRKDELGKLEKKKHLSIEDIARKQQLKTGEFSVEEKTKRDEFKTKFDILSKKSKDIAVGESNRNKQLDTIAKRTTSRIREEKIAENKRKLNMSDFEKFADKANEDKSKIISLDTYREKKKQLADTLMKSAAPVESNGTRISIIGEEIYKTKNKKQTIKETPTGLGIGSPREEINREHSAMTSASKKTGAVNINTTNNIPTPIVEVKIENTLDENGMRSMIKKTSRHEQNKEGTQLSSVGIERQAQVSYGS